MLPVLSEYKFLGVKNVSPEVLGHVQANFGSIQYDLGTRLRGQEGKRFLNNAVECLDKALAIFDARKHPERHAEILSLRSMAVTELRSRYPR